MPGSGAERELLLLSCCSSDEFLYSRDALCLHYLSSFRMNLVLNPNRFAPIPLW